MKHPFTKRLLALALSFSLAAALALPALAEGEDAGGTGVTITGDVYYGTDYVQFDINGGERTDLFYDVNCEGQTVPVYQHVQYKAGEGDVNSVGIDLEEGQSPEKFSITVYTGRTAQTETNVVATKKIAGIYADLDGGSEPVLIGSVVADTDVTTLTFPETYYDQENKKDYDLVPSSATYKDGRYTARYTAYEADPLTGSITYVDSTGAHLDVPEDVPTTIGSITRDTPQTVTIPESFQITKDGKTTTYYPRVNTVEAAYDGQIDFVILCEAYNINAEDSGKVQIQYMADGKAVFTDEVILHDTTFLYKVPQQFVHQTAEEDGSIVTTLYTLGEKQDVLLPENNILPLRPGFVEETYTLNYTAQDANESIQWHLMLVDGVTGELLGTVDKEVEPGETVTFDPAAEGVNIPAGYTAVEPEYTYTYGGENLIQYVYYVPEGAALTSYNDVVLRFVNIANGAVLQSETITVDPGADTIISCPASFSVGGNTYVRLDGQNDTYRHSYFSPKRTYTIYYRDINDILYANTVITNIETVMVERVDEGLVYTEDAGALTGGAAGGGAYVTGPGGATGIVNEDTGMNEAVNEEGQSLAEEREEQIAEGETPLAQAPGGEDTAPGETITGNEPAQAGLSTALMVGGSAAALALAVVLVVLIVVQRKRNRAAKR